MARQRQSLEKRKQEEKESAQAQSNLYGIFFLVGIVVVVGLAVYFYLNQEAPLPDIAADFDLSTVEDNSIAYENQGQQHYSSDAPRDPYNSNPPTSGPHNPNWMTPLGVYTQQPPDDLLIHNLEHGHVWISFRDEGDTEAIQLLTAIQQKYSDRVIITYRPENDSRIAVAAWTRLLPLEELDREQIEAFIVRHSDNAPESIMGR